MLKDLDSKKRRAQVAVDDVSMILVRCSASGKEVAAKPGVWIGH